MPIKVSILRPGIAVPQPSTNYTSPMLEILIRPADASEKEELEALQFRASLTNAGDRDAILAHPDAIEIPPEQITGGRLFVAVSNGIVVGFAAVEPRPDGGTELDALFVEPTHRRQGIARLLVNHCAEVARKKGSTALHVIGNPHAEEFYLDSGFKQIGTFQTRFGSGLLMRKELLQ
ncbi:MAG: GNAT family N-acetyltransferase [Terracidiphilus sp.]